MAEKVLQTRIINKHAELSAWISSSLVLKEGEIALAKLTTIRPDGGTQDNYIAKIGTGKTFAESAPFYANASDVYAWAKTATKPGYNASEIVRGESTVAADLTAAENAISALQTSVGGTSVADAIKAAIEALDVTDAAVEKQFVTAVAEADGKISVTRRALTADDIPTLEIAKINGLQSALDAKAATTVTDAISARLDTGDIKKAIDAAATAASGAQTTIDNYKTANDAALALVKETAEAATTVDEATGIANTAVSNFKTQHFDGLATRVGTAEQNIEANATAISDLAGEGNTSTVKANADAIAKLAQDIGNVANVMNFRGVSVKGEGTAPGHDISDPKAGDVIIYGDAEYVYDASGAWVKFGDASDNATAISELQGRVSSLETADGEQDKLIAANAGAAKDAQDAADAAQADADEANRLIGIINGTGDGSIAKAVEDAKTELKGYADTAEADALSAAKTYTDGEIDKVEKTVNDLATTVGQNKTDAENATKAVADDLAEYVESNDAALDVVRQNAQKGVDDAAAALAYAKNVETAKVDENTKAIAANADDIATIENNYARVENNKLVYGQGDSVMTIIFDCGGVDEL